MPVRMFQKLLFVMCVLQFKGDLFMLLSPRQCCRNSVFFLRCSESSASHWADDSFVFVSGGCLEINPSVFSSQCALSEPPLGGGAVVRRGLVGLCRGGWNIRAVSPNVSYSCSLSFAEIEVLTDETLMKSAAKIKASPTCSSLLTPVPALPAPARRWQDRASASASVVHRAAAGRDQLSSVLQAEHPSCGPPCQLCGGDGSLWLREKKSWWQRLETPATVCRAAVTQSLFWLWNCTQLHPGEQRDLAECWAAAPDIRGNSRG